MINKLKLLMILKKGFFITLILIVAITAASYNLFSSYEKVNLSPPGQCSGACPVLGSTPLSGLGDGSASYVVSKDQNANGIYSSITCRNAKQQAADNCKVDLQKKIDAEKKLCDAKKTQCESGKTSSCSCIFPVYATPFAYCSLPDDCNTDSSSFSGDIGSSLDSDGTKTPDARDKKEDGDIKITSTAHAEGSVTFNCPCEGKPISGQIPVDEEPIDKLKNELNNEPVGRDSR